MAGDAVLKVGVVLSPTRSLPPPALAPALQFMFILSAMSLESARVSLAVGADDSNDRFVKLLSRTAAIEFDG